MIEIYVYMLPRAAGMGLPVHSAVFMHVVLSASCTSRRARVCAAGDVLWFQTYHTIEIYMCAQRPRRLCFARAAAPRLLTHAEVTETMIFFEMGPKLRHPMVIVFCWQRAHMQAQWMRILTTLPSSLPLSPPALRTLDALSQPTVVHAPMHRYAAVPWGT